MQKEKANTDFINKAIGKTLNSFILERNGLTQEKVSLAANLSRLKLNRLLNGKTKLTVDVLLLLLRVLKISPTRFFNRLRKAKLKNKMVIDV